MAGCWRTEPETAWIGHMSRSRYSSDLAGMGRDTGGGVALVCASLLNMSFTPFCILVHTCYFSYFPLIVMLFLFLLIIFCENCTDINVKDMYDCATSFVNFNKLSPE